MATIDQTGISTTDLSGHYTSLRKRFTDTFGSDLSTESETPQGQLIGILAEVFAEIDEGFVQLANAFSVNTAGGVQLDHLFSLAAVERKLSTVSTVTATMSGVPGTNIPFGSRVKTTAGDEFQLRRDALIPQGGSVDGIFSAVERGAVPIPANSLTNIVTVTTGWEGVTNAAAGQEGVDTETDATYRKRGKVQSSQNSPSTIDAIRSALVKVGVTRSRVIENTTAMPMSVTGIANIPAHSVVAIVDGGIDEDIARAIQTGKTLGAGTFGGESYVLNGETIRFQRVEEVAVKLSITITTDNLFPNQGVPLIKDALVRHANARWEIGELIDTEQLRVPIYSIPGAALSSVPTLTDTNDAALPDADNTPEQRLYTLVVGDISVTV